MIIPVHLEKNGVVNYGAYYTDKNYVEIVWKFVLPYIDNNTVIFDPACGYGNFLYKKFSFKKIGNDIDETAISMARERIPDTIFLNFNALTNPKREKYSIQKSEKLIIIGNPPYNDTTSQAKKRIKNINFEIDEDLKARDIGISFLRMFDKLEADIVCVLHPLSYLIKETNFNLLKDFTNNYRIIDNIIISSKVFNFTSKNTDFPIIIALYKRNNYGMNFEDIKVNKFKSINGKVFSLIDFDYIGNYVDKYPKKRMEIKNGDLLFYTLRDINALRRNRTFIQKPINNAVKIDIKKLDYYVYIDVFKDFINYVPFYLRNLDILFDSKLFNKYKSYFISYSLRKNYELLRDKYSEHHILKNDKENIKKYMIELLKEHYYEDLLML